VQWLGFESGIIVTFIGIIILFLFCAIIGITIWITGLLTKEKGRISLQQRRGRRKSKGA